MSKVATERRDAGQLSPVGRILVSRLIRILTTDNAANGPGGNEA
jgi:hypothetical protein